MLTSLHCFSNFIILSSTQNQEEFSIVKSHLKEADIDYFYDQLIDNNTIYFCEVKMGYDEGAENDPINFDLSSFPFYEAVNLENLSPEQREMAKELKRNSGKESKKLVSYLKQDNVICEYAENIIYSIGIHSQKLLETYRIVRCKAAPIFRPWITHLQEIRTQSPSTLLGKCLKGLCNSLTGKHMSL